MTGEEIGKEIVGVGVGEGYLCFDDLKLTFATILVWLSTVIAYCFVPGPALSLKMKA